MTSDGLGTRIRHARKLRGMTQQALAKAAEYEADLVFDTYWKPILADLEAQLTPPTRQQRRAARRKAA